MFSKLSIAAVLLISIFVVGDAQIKEKPADSRAVLKSRGINLVEPEYPKIAEDLCAGGRVEVETVLDAQTGKVLKAIAISGDELLREASVKAIKATKFPPSGVHHAAYVKGILVYDFDSFVKKKCIDGGILNSKALNLPKPVINSHIKIKTEIEVKVRVLVDLFEGKVVAAHTGAGHPLLRQALTTAAKNSTFTPFQHGIQRLFVKGIIIYKIKPDRTVETKL